MKRLITILLLSAVSITAAPTNHALHYTKGQKERVKIKQRNIQNVLIKIEAKRIKSLKQFPFLQHEKFVLKNVGATVRLKGHTKIVYVKYEKDKVVEIKIDSTRRSIRSWTQRIMTMKVGGGISLEFIGRTRHFTVTSAELSFSPELRIKALQRVLNNLNNVIIMMDRKMADSYHKKNQMSEWMINI